MSNGTINKGSLVKGTSGSGGGGKIPSQEGQEGKVLSTNGEQLEWVEGYKPNLFDIKTNSEPMIQKGWSCISYPTQNKLNKADVPTAYEFLKEKLDGADGTISALTQVLGNVSNTDGKHFRIIDDTVYYFKSSDGLYKASFANFSNTANWTKICSLDYDGAVDFDIEHKLFGIARRVTSGDCRGTIVNLVNGETIEFQIQDSSNYTYNCFFFENCFYISASPSCYRYNLNTSTFELVYGSYNVSGGNATLEKIYAHNENYYYFNVVSSGTIYAVRASDILDTTTYHIFYSGNEFNVHDGFCCKYNNRLYARYQNDYNNYSAKNYIDLSNDTIVTDVPLMTYTFVAISTVYWGYIIKTTDNKYLFTNNFSSYTELYSGSYLYGCDSNGSFVVVQDNITIYCSAPNKTLTAYTDTINGIDIKYYKNGDWKICTPTIAVGNDDNLQDVFEYLGYLNYWWIDTANEQITLQRNSNMWTMMYVGDNYEDDELPSGNPTRLLPQKNYVEDTTSATISFDEDNIIQPNTDYVFGTLTSLEFDTDSYVENQLETTIKFTAGTGFTFTDNSGITWVDGTPTFTEGSNYLILIFNNLAFIREW